jgi:hypothetical protein
MVNTFLPYANFEKTAKTLDYKRLGKQRVEAHQIVNILENPSKYKGWKHHPAVLMWKGHLPYLKQYYNTIVEEWIKRGYNNNMILYSKNEIKTTKYPPWWLGFRPLHKAYKANLLRKNKKYYTKFFSVPMEYMKYSYVWPTKLTEDVLKKIKAGKSLKIDDLAVKISSLPKRK